ncbi:aminotransferase class V-fold PLP-dependent enzyme [Pseudogracilibacillus auburnensis]|uniref:Selenocysteine lyase/cysteine desulfurase n=1 Tax=Pseudogracilibacillus auburnensis TaxID=1494959 RepID=A0A2V3W214_9BACI|nr:aminotransferase class V-fold PLP-dependent enzyme [Pseudogracilibacillus auburnensis]PXW86295.1 selenocysteine lyase/cysteine desulfurase [Pseudogracilibacillus auburnensis]
MRNLAQQFIGLNKKTYFYTGAECPSLLSNESAVKQYVQDKSLGELGRKRFYKIENKLKDNLAKMLHCKSTEISFSGNASEAMNNLIDCLDVPEKSNIIINDLEYPSVVFPLLNLREKGVEIRTVNHSNGEILQKELEKLIDDNTFLVAVSHVSFVNGYKHNLKALRKLTNRFNALLLVDATQSLGVSKVNSQYCDFIISSSYKWLLGAHGVGVCYVSEQMIKELHPRRVGWRSVKEIFHDERLEKYEYSNEVTKLELGYNAYPTIYMLENSTTFLLEVGIANIEQRVGELGDYLIQQLKTNGFTILSPELAENRGGNIAFKALNGEAVMTELLKEDIHVWGGDGRVRVSINFYNDESQIDQLMGALIALKGEMIDE